MAGVAIIRIKRPIEDEPLNGLLVNCKRRKTEVDETQANTVLHFVGTLDEPTDDIVKHIQKTSKHELEQQYKTHFNNISAKIKAHRDIATKTSRFKLINHYRSQTLTDEDAASNLAENYTILDVDSVDNKESNDCKEKKYVYDLYYTDSHDFNQDDNYDYQDIDIHPLSYELLSTTGRDNDVKPDNEDTSDDSDDSNAENNWRNDYPDEDSEQGDSDVDSITEEDMRVAMTRVTLGSDSSSDEDIATGDKEDDDKVTEGFVYSIDSEAAGFEEDVDDSDEQRYGERYARFKARHTTADLTPVVSNHQDLYYGDIDEDEYYY